MTRAVPRSTRGTFCLSVTNPARYGQLARLDCEASRRRVTACPRISRRLADSAAAGYRLRPMLKKVDRILVRVASLDSAVSYYRDVVGLKLVKQDARLASFRMLDGQTELVLHCDADLPDQAMYYLVDS